MGCNQSKTRESQPSGSSADEPHPSEPVATATTKPSTRSDSRNATADDGQNGSGGQQRIAPARRQRVQRDNDDTDNDEDDDDDGELPVVCSKFQNGKPEMEGEAIECFKGGLLFRIVNGDTWAFFNDTTEFEMHVDWRFGPDSSLQALGSTTTRRDENDWIAVSCVVYPGETELFIRGSYNGYKSSMSAKPLSLEYRNKMNAEADALVQTELDSVRKLVRGSTDEERNLASCVAQGVFYLDVNFLPRHESLSRSIDTRQLPPTAWKRPEQFLPPQLRSHIRLFRKIEPNDICQGSLGDCYLLCALAALAEFPAKVKDIFAHPFSNDQARAERALGAYRVTINKHGWWHMVIMDDYLPVVGARPCFARNNDDPGEMWVSLLEKAYAKVHGSYSSITGGDALHVLQDWTGYPVNRFDDEWEAAVSSEAGSDELFRALVHYDEEHYLINLNTPGNDNSEYMRAASSGNSEVFEEKYKQAGLGMGHAYTVLSVKEFPRHNLRLLKIRNPWGGSVEWTGAWSDDDEQWQRYPDVARACNHVPAHDGTFWMSWDCVKSYFDGGGVCFTKFDWFDYRAKGSFENGFPNLAFEVTVDQPTQMFAILSQKDKRGLPPEDPDADYAAMMLSVVPFAGDGRHKMHLNSTTDADRPSEDHTYAYARDLALEYTFTPEASPYFVVPRVYDAGASKAYVLGLISETRVGAGGAGVTVRFKTIDKRCRMFQNYPRFTCETTDFHTSYQFNPERGTAVTQEGCGIEA